MLVNFLGFFFRRRRVDLSYKRYRAPAFPGETLDDIEQEAFKQFELANRKKEKKEKETKPDKQTRE